MEALDPDREGFWDLVIARIASGSEPWLQTVPCLRLGAVMSDNPEYVRDMDRALAAALPVNPVGVLALAGRGVSLKAACSYPFPDMDVALARARIGDARTALERVQEERYRTDRQVCELRLGKVAEGFRSPADGTAGTPR